MDHQGRGCWLPTSSRGFAVIDCETTGLEQDSRIIQFCIVLLDKDLHYESHDVSFVRGDGTVGSDEARSVHGISPDDTRDAPTFEKILPQFEHELRTRMVFAHYSVFDKARLDYELSLIGRPPLGAVGCTKTLGDVLGYGILRLREVSKLFGIVNENPHDAASDAITASLVLAEFARRHPVEFSAYLVEQFSLTDDS